MKVVTRFAPSPTGVLHTGSARTALFNYLFARKHQGQFLLRIEDTDIERSDERHIQAILSQLRWLGMEWDGDVVYQLRRSARHAEVAHKLVELGKAYYCYASQQEVEEFRANFPHQKFISPWRDQSKPAPTDTKPVVRLKITHTGSTTINDLIQGEISVNNSELDDMVMLRSDGVPTYMLAVVVDDYDMGITHVIRGDDHLTNAFRQKQIYDALGWDTPLFAHIPLIHDKEGGKLSKRKGAMGLDTYAHNGYLPQAVVNHLLRLGWGHGDQEIFTMEEAIELFSLDAVGKSPARFDLEKLNFINAHYIKNLENGALMEMLSAFLPTDLPSALADRIARGLDGLKVRASTLLELAENAEIYIAKKAEPDEKSREMLTKITPEMQDAMRHVIETTEPFSKDVLHAAFEKLAAKEGVKLPFIMQSLRALLLGTFAAPGIFEVMEVLGQQECLARLEK